MQVINESEPGQRETLKLIKGLVNQPARLGAMVINNIEEDLLNPPPGCASAPVRY